MLPFYGVLLTSSCWGNFSLQCGGDSYNSIYSARVPTIASVILKAPPHVVTNSSFSVVAEVVLKGLNTSSFIESNNSDPAINFKMIVVTWRFGSTESNSTSVFGKGNLTIATSIYASEIGQHYLCVHVTNTVTQSYSCIELEVLAPVRDLNVVEISRGLKTLNESSLSSLVTTGTSVEVIISVKGSNLEFEFDFGDETRPLKKQEHGTSSPLDLTCVVKAYATHIYNTCGNYTVNITVSNAISSKTITLRSRFTVEKAISKLSFDKVFASPSEQTMFALVIPQLKPNCNVQFKWNFGDGSAPLYSTGKCFLCH